MTLGRRSTCAARWLGALASMLSCVGLAACRTEPESGSPAPVTSDAPSTSASSGPEASAAALAPSGSATPGAPEPTAKPAPPAPRAPPEGMLEIPGGFFLQGSPVGEGTPEEHPAHEVALPSFYLERTEVTVAAYRACVTAGACKPPHQGDMCNYRDPTRDDHPINCVDLRMAEAYCAHVGRRLPTEAEWEYAARGGAEQRKFSWGADDPSQKNACYMHVGGSCKVGSYPPGAFGLFDMSGNVWEWTSTPFGPYPGGQAYGDYVVYRGGSWSRRFPKWLRNGLRNRYLPKEHSAALGFRCAADVPSATCPSQSERRAGRCVRTAGTPLCEPKAIFDGKQCVVDGRASVASWQGQAAAMAEVEAKKGVEAGSDPATIKRVRTPGDDADCAAFYKGKPHAYRFVGGSFQARNPLIAAGGCTRRDMGLTWTSVCCPGASAPEKPEKPETETPESPAKPVTPEHGSEKAGTSVPGEKQAPGAAKKGDP